MSVPDQAQQARRRRLVLTASALVAVVIVVAAYWFFAFGPGVRVLSPPRSTVVEFSGTSDQSTATFQARSGWRIHWQSDGQRFAMAVRGDADLGTVIEVSEPASGVTAPAGTGSFWLDITADGAWSLRIEQGD